MAVKVIYNMQWLALKSKQWMCTEFTADSWAYFFSDEKYFLFRVELPISLLDFHIMLHMLLDISVI